MKFTRGSAMTAGLTEATVRCSCKKDAWLLQRRDFGGHIYIYTCVCVCVCVVVVVVVGGGGGGGGGGNENCSPVVVF